MRADTSIGRKTGENMTDTVVYVSNAASKEIYALTMSRESGDLDLLDKVPVPGTDKPSPSSMPMAVSPDHRFLYAALRSDSFPVSSFAIDPASGRLTHLATTPLQDSMAYIVTDRTGRHLLGASYPGAKLTINPIDAQRPCRRKDDADHSGQAQGALHCRRSEQSLLLCADPRRGRHLAMEIRRRHRRPVAERAR